MDNLEALKRLQGADLDISKAQKELASLDGTGTETEAALAKTRLLEKKAAEDLAAIQREVKLKEGEVTDLAGRRGKLEAKLQKATTAKAAEAVNHELAALDEKIGAAEEAQLEVMEKEEEAAGVCAKIAEAIATLEGKLSSIADAVPKRRAELEKSIESGQQDREKWRGYIDEDDLQRYDKLAKKLTGGLVVVEVDTACAACDRTFTSSLRQTYMEHKDQVHLCQGCGAMMIYVGAVSL